VRYENYQRLAISRSERTLTVTLNAPERLNVVDAEMHEELSRVFYDVDADTEADVVVLTGAGRAFCGGGDIKAMKDWYENPEFFDVMAREAKKIVFGLLDCEKPIICKMNGDAYGLGATLALFCDVIFASDKARIADPHVRVGLAAGDGGAIIWPQLIGFARAKELLMTGDAIDAPRAAQMGLINHAVAAEELDQKVEAFVQRLSSGAMKSIKWTKISVNIALKQLAHSIMDTCIAYEALSNRTGDHAEAIDAFANKRKPRFTGQ